MSLTEILKTADKGKLEVLEAFQEACPLPTAKDVREWSEQHPAHHKEILEVAIALFSVSPFTIASGAVTDEEAREYLRRLKAIGLRRSRRRLRLGQRPAR